MRPDCQRGRALVDLQRGHPLGLQGAVIRKISLDRGGIGAAGRGTREAPIDAGAVPRYEQRHVSSIGRKRFLDAAPPERRMNRRADFPEAVRSACVRIEGWRGFPFEPGDVVLFGAEQQRFRKIVVPSAEQLARKSRRAPAGKSPERDSLLREKAWRASIVSARERLTR